jgi:hypothetical protein
MSGHVSWREAWNSLATKLANCTRTREGETGEAGMDIEGGRRGSGDGY